MLMIFSFYLKIQIEKGKRYDLRFEKNNKSIQFYSFKQIENKINLLDLIMRLILIFIENQYKPIQ